MNLDACWGPNRIVRAVIQRILITQPILHAGSHYM